MSAATQGIEARNDVEQLVQDLLHSGSVRFSLSSGDGFFHVNLEGAGQEGATCSCHQDLWIVHTAHWRFYARLGDTRQVRFMRRPDPHAPEREELSVNLVGPNGATVLKGAFTPLYDEQNRPLAAPFARWEALRAKYGGRDEVPVANGRMPSLRG